MQELFKKDDAFDSVVGSFFEETPKQTIKLTASTLKVQGLKSISRRVSKVDESTYKVITKSKTITAARLTRTLSSMNLDNYVVEYSDDLEDNELIHMTDKPLWAVTKNNDGVFFIKKVRG